MSFNPFQEIEEFVSSSKTIEMIDIELLIENEKNRYRTKDEADIEVQNEELIASIEEFGVLQPLLVREMNGYYKIISGHRRNLMCQRLVEEGKEAFNKIPCIIDNQIIDDDDEQLKIIATNKNREKNTWEKIEEVRIMTEILERKKEKGEIKGGRLIEWVAKNLEMSTSTVDRLQKIDKGLEPELKEALKTGDLKQSPAESLARMSAADQKTVYEQTGGKVTQADVDRYKEEKSYQEDDGETSILNGIENDSVLSNHDSDWYNKLLEKFNEVGIQGLEPCEQCKFSHPFCNKCCKVCEEPCNLKQGCRKQVNLVKNETNTEEKILAAKYAMKVLEKAICKCSSLRDIEEQEGNQDKASQQIANIEYLGGVMKNVQADLFNLTGHDMFKEDEE